MSESSGKLVGIYLGSRKGDGKSLVQNAELITQHGMLGDSHAGGHPKRQVSLFAHEVLDELLTAGFEVPAGELSANLFTAGINLNSLKPGARLRVGPAIIEITEARKPCRSITRIDHRLPKLLYGKCGQLAVVIEGGRVSEGDEVVLIVDEPQGELFEYAHS